LNEAPSFSLYDQTPFFFFLLPPRMADQTATTPSFLRAFFAHRFTSEGVALWPPIPSPWTNFLCSIAFPDGRFFLPRTCCYPSPSVLLWSSLSAALLLVRPPRPRSRANNLSIPPLLDRESRQAPCSCPAPQPSVAKIFLIRSVRHFFLFDSFIIPPSGCDLFIIYFREDSLTPPSSVVG